MFCETRRESFLIAGLLGARARGDQRTLFEVDQPKIQLVAG
jgi:hypothetical protein